MTTPAYEHDLAHFCDLVGETLSAEIRYEGRLHRVSPGPDGNGQDMAGTSSLYAHRRWFGKSNLRLAFCIETAWSLPGYDVDAFLQCGQAYGKSLSRFLQAGEQR
jgi:hypothetical protein